VNVFLPTPVVVALAFLVAGLLFTFGADAEEPHGCMVALACFLALFVGLLGLGYYLGAGACR
jgi:hypothetical protein